MTDEIRPVGGPGPVDPALDRRESDRRRRQRREASKALAIVETPELHPEAGPARAAVHPASEPGSAAFAAQQMGQTGQKRGLRAGPPMLDAARAAYLGAEYSGSAERRPPAGKATKTEI